MAEVATMATADGAENTAVLAAVAAMVASADLVSKVQS